MWLVNFPCGLAVLRCCKPPLFFLSPDVVLGVEVTYDFQPGKDLWMQLEDALPS